MKTVLILGLLAVVGCGNHTAALPLSDADIGQPEASVLEAGVPPSTPCDSTHFTACVQKCGAPVDHEPVVAKCIEGTFHCEAGRTAAPDCPTGSWPSQRPCGPWPGTYNCGLGCGLCTAMGVWTCGDCPDAGTQATD